MPYPNLGIAGKEDELVVHEDVILHSAIFLDYIDFFIKFQFIN